MIYRTYIIYIYNMDLYLRCKKIVFSFRLVAPQQVTGFPCRIQQSSISCKSANQNMFLIVTDNYTLQRHVVLVNRRRHLFPLRTLDIAGETSYVQGPAAPR